MPVVLLVVGLVLAIVGLLTLGFGIPIKDFSFGNTLIVAGTLAVGAGIIVMALAFALRELRRIADLLEHRPMVQARPSARSRPAAPAGAPFDLHEAQLPRAPAEPSLAPPTSPYGAPEPRASEPAWPGGRETLESEREAARAAPSSPPPGVPLSSPPPPPPPPPWAGEARRSPPSAPLPSTPPPVHPHAPAEEEADEASARPSLAERFGFPSRRDAKRPDWKRPSEPTPAGEPPQRDFDMVWPTSREGERAGQPSAPPSPLPAPVGTSAEDDDVPAPQAVSVLKSGAVDGMNYTLYSDGSIEAQLPEGTARFSSIDDLRAHLDQRDGR